MKRAIMLALVATVVAATSPGYAASSSTSGPGAKIKNGVKAIGKGIMWGPKKVGQGFKKIFGKK